MTPIRDSHLLRALALAGAVFGFTLAAPAAAVVGAIDDVPAATLLLPYFEVDLDDANGPQTTFTVTNVEAAPVMAHVTLWSNLGKPTYSFDLYLGGRDAVEVDLRLAFRGVLPRTGPTLKTAGPHSDAPAVLCSSKVPGDFHPGFPVQLLSANAVTHLQMAHTGRASPLAGNLCLGARQDDRVARGYVTIDTASDCGEVFPSAPGYFVAGGGGFASNRNALIGTYATIERDGRDSVTSSMVHLEADATNPITSEPGAYTFWSKSVASTAADNREPVGTVWETRIFQLQQFDTNAQIVAWRDVPVRAPHSCNAATPPGFPLGQHQVVAFDEEEQHDAINDEMTYPNPPPPFLNAFPVAAQRVDAATFMPFASGFVRFNLNTFQNPPVSFVAPDLAQSWVGMRTRLGGVYGALLPAQQLFAPHQQEAGAGSCTASISFCSYRDPEPGQ